MGIVTNQIETLPAMATSLIRDAKLARFGAFGTTLLEFFFAEMDDKTQIATIVLAAQYHAFFAVVAGTTSGMMIADIPAVFLADRIAHRMPVRLVHRIAAAIRQTSIAHSRPAPCPKTEYNRI